MTDQTDKATADFERAVALNPSFPIAFVQKLYTDYRRATTSQDPVGVKNVINSFEKALEEHPKCVETYALFSQVKLIISFLGHD